MFIGIPFTRLRRNSRQCRSNTLRGEEWGGREGTESWRGNAVEREFGRVLKANFSPARCRFRLDLFSTVNSGFLSSIGDTYCSLDTDPRLSIDVVVCRTLSLFPLLRVFFFLSLPPSFPSSLCFTTLRPFLLSPLPNGEPVSPFVVYYFSFSPSRLPTLPL